jgi:hypothetical protein
MSCDF